MTSETRFWGNRDLDRLRADAEGAGFAWPDGLSGEALADFVTRPGYATTALFAFQAERVVREYGVALERTDEPLKPAWAVEPLWQAFESLTCGADAAEALDELRPLAVELPRRQRLASFPALPLKMISRCEGEQLHLAADALSWLVAASWALASADGSHRGYITAFTGQGALWRRARCSGYEYDRLLLRSQLNDTPTLQASAVLAKIVPQRPDNWLLATGRTLARLEYELAELPLEQAEPQRPVPTFKAPRGIAVQLGGLRFFIAPPVLTPSGSSFLPLMLCGPDGCTVLEAQIVDDRVHTVERPPLGYAGQHYAERIELIAENLTAALSLALARLEDHVAVAVASR